MPTVDPHRLETLEEVRRFLARERGGGRQAPDRASAYRIVEESLTRFRYHELPRSDKGVVLRYLARVTGKSPPQIQRLVRQHRETGLIRDRRGAPPSAFRRSYTRADIRLLADIDQALGQLCGPSTRRVMRRLFEEYGDERFERLASISNGHFYNLRKSTTYRRRRTTGPKRRVAVTGAIRGGGRKPVSIRSGAARRRLGKRASRRT
ncbi:MAG: hypothetical protein F4Y77_17895 [Holophagales bacterium]|nr:hypothetical protein [Holophagales bacterium]